MNCFYNNPLSGPANTFRNTSSGFFTHCMQGIMVIFSLLVFMTAAKAQIYEPDGLRMPGEWNGWNNTTGMGGAFDLQVNKTGTLRWQTTFQYTGSTGNQEFKFVSTAFGDPWGNQWAGNANLAVNTFQNVVYGTPSDPNNKIALTQNKWYSVVWEDKGYTDTQVLFMETSNQPLNPGELIRQPLLVTAQDEVEVTLTLPGSPSPEEKFFLRYTADAWATSTVLPLTLSGNTGTAVIPAFADDITVEYYAFSTTLTPPFTDPDLLTLKISNNAGQNYSYTVGQSIQCGQAVDVVTTEPAFPQETLPVLIYFNAEMGNGGLFDYEGDVYAHTGVITNLSTSSSDWKYVKTEWGQNTPETKLTRISANLYSLQIQNIRSYYGVPAAEKILKIALVFRGGEEASWDGYPEHKNADGSDIFVTVYDPVLNVKIMSPSKREPLASQNEVLAVCVEALKSDIVELYLGNDFLTSDTAKSIAYPLELQGYSPGSYWVKAVARQGGATARDSVRIFLRGPVTVADLPAGMKNGINYIDNQTVTLVLHDPAAKKSFAFAIGEHSNWGPDGAGYMNRTPDGKHYWVTLTGLQPQKEYAYQYYVDGKLKLADPYSDKVLDPWNDRWIPSTTYPGLKAYPFDLTTGVVSVFETGRQAYNWQVPAFVPPAVHATQSDLVIYELLLRDFTEEKNLTAAMAHLDYLKDLGVNAIELMPVMEFDGNESWGYAPNFFFAPDKYYGTREMYKQFVDACHQRGMAVILDIVMNHAFGQCPLVQMYWADGQPAADNPWLNPEATHPFNVGYDFNHESPYTRQFFKDVLAFWLTEYRFDGFRFDLSKGLTQKYSGNDVAAWSQYDQSRINILTDYYNHIKSVNPNAYVILEHFANNDEEVVLANTGMLLWSGMHNQYKQVGIGWPDNSNLSWAYHASRGFTYPNLIDYMENHDEERIMFEALSWGNASGGYNLKDTLTAVGHQEMAAVLFMGIPGPKMLWQFGEMGYDYSIQYGGERTANKPPRWDYAGKFSRERLMRVYAAMATLQKSDAFRFGSYTHDLSGTGKRMWIAHGSMNVSIAANMGVSGFDMAPGFAAAGTWYDYFTGESINISDPAGHTFYFGPGKYRVFTSIPLPRPFFHLAATVLDASTGLPLSGVKFTASTAGERISDTEGKAAYTLLPKSHTLTLTRQGYLPKDTTFTLNGDASVTFRMGKGPNALPEAPGHSIRVYPNPARDYLVIEGAAGYQITLTGTDGRILSTESPATETHRMQTRHLSAGIYLLRFEKDAAGFYRKVVIW